MKMNAAVYSSNTYAAKGAARIRRANPEDYSNFVRLALPC
jgi:hypothetical protein